MKNFAKISFAVAPLLFCQLVFAGPADRIVNHESQSSPNTAYPSADLTVNNFEAPLGMPQSVKPGNMNNFPKIGDSVTIDYKGYVYSASAKDNRGEKFDEGNNVTFVIGKENTLVGNLDREIEKMSVGQHSRVILESSTLRNGLLTKNISGMKTELDRNKLGAGSKVVYEIKLKEINGNSFGWVDSVEQIMH